MLLGTSSKHNDNQAQWSKTAVSSLKHTKAAAQVGCQTDEITFKYTTSSSLS